METAAGIYSPLKRVQKSSANVLKLFKHLIQTENLKFLRHYGREENLKSIPYFDER